MKTLKQYTYAVVCFVTIACLCACKPSTPKCTHNKPSMSLEEAIERRNECAVEYWASDLKHAPDVHFMHHITPRMLAAKTGNIPILESLLNTNWSNTDEDDAGMTPLHWAVQYNQIEAIKKLLAAGYDIEAEDKRGDTPLRYAIRNKNTELVDFLIKKGADVNKADEEGTTPLMVAAQWCYTPQASILKRLLKAGAKTGLNNKWGQSALSLASEEYCHECIKLLLEAGEDVNNHYEQIPLLVAAQYCDEETADILIKAGADVSVRTEDKETPFLVAAKYGCVTDEDTVRFFTNSGIDILAKDAFGNTAFDVVNEREVYITNKAAELLKQEVEKAKKRKFGKK